MSQPLSLSRPTLLVSSLLLANCSSNVPGNTTGALMTGGGAGAPMTATGMAGTNALANSGGMGASGAPAAAGSTSMGTGGMMGASGAGVAGAAVTGGGMGGGAATGTGGMAGMGTGGMPMGGSSMGGAELGGADTGGTLGGAGGAGTGGAGAGGAGAGEFVLTSPSHEEGAVFAAEFTCDNPGGFNGSIIPELHWTAGPPGTMSYAITFIDVTLAHRETPDQNGYHWVIWNIPADVLTLEEGFTDEASIGAEENNDYLGPCPNFGGGSANTDTYEFTIYALAEESISISGSGTAAARNAEELLEGMNLASAKLTGTSQAAPGN